MKFVGSFAAVACLFAGSDDAAVDAFAPASTARESTTSLRLRSDQEMFDTMTLANGQYAGGRNVDGGYSVGVRGFYPSYSRGGSLYYPGGGYGNRGMSSITGPSYGFNNGMGYDYGYSGYNDIGFYGGLVQGESRRTFPTSGTDSSTVQLETDGRPLNANVEVWQGPGNNPAKMRLYSEDGYLRPWVAGFANTPRGGYSTSLSVNNEANVAFPIRANMMGDRNYNSRSYGGYVGGYGYGGGYGGGDGGYVGSSRRSAINVDGGALRTFSFPPGVQAVVVEIWSEDFPCYADVELWDGPNAVKQAAEIYTDSGYDRPWSAIIENPRFDSATIAVRNVGPLEFPLKVCVEPIY